MRATMLSTRTASRATQPLLYRRALRSTFSTSTLRRALPQYQPPTSPSSQEAPAPADEKSNAHRDFWKSFGRPMAKVFLMALFTYQVLHYGWLRLEAMEEREDKEGLMLKLEDDVRVLGSTLRKETGAQDETHAEAAVAVPRAEQSGWGRFLPWSK